MSTVRPSLRPLYERSDQNQVSSPCTRLCCRIYLYSLGKDDRTCDLGTVDLAQGGQVTLLIPNVVYVKRSVCKCAHFTLPLSSITVSIEHEVFIFSQDAYTRWKSRGLTRWNILISEWSQVSWSCNAGAGDVLRVSPASSFLDYAPGIEPRHTDKHSVISKAGLHFFLISALRFSMYAILRASRSLSFCAQPPREERRSRSSFSCARSPLRSNPVPKKCRVWVSGCGEEQG